MFYYMKILSGLFFLQIAWPFSHFKTSPQGLRLAKDPACRGQKDGKFVKDPYSCDKFYYCGPNETAIVVDCPYGMIFNDEKEICDFPTNYHCVPRIKEGEEGISTTSAKLQTTVYTQKESSSTTPSALQITFSTVSTKTTTLTITKPSVEVETDKNCPLNDNKTLIFLQHPSDCHRYFICYHGVPVEQECISELHWNPQTNRCDFPNNSECFVPTVIPSTAGVSVEGMLRCPFRGEQIFPHPVNCNYFIYCINGYATVQQCPFYHHFDIQSRRCLWQTIATCVIKK